MCPASLSGLETACGELIAQRGGIDRPTARRKLLGRGIALRAPRDFRSDIDRLKAHGEMIAEALRRYEVIGAAADEPVGIDRENAKMLSVMLRLEVPCSSRANPGPVQ